MLDKKTKLLSIVGVIASLSLGISAQAGDLSEKGAQKLQKRFIKIAKEASPKTVCVLGVAGSGTGAVISADGLVVTNAHVAAVSRYSVLLFSDGTKRLAKRQGIDYGRDLAFYRLVKKPAEALPFFELAKANPEFGSWIAAIGYPGGPRTTAAPTFSIGVVRKGAGPGNVNGVLNYSDAITSDAPLFPGNSGGPMVDLQGRLAGINGAVNLQGTASYSIPIARVRQRMKQLSDGVIMLPQGQSINIKKNFIARGLFKLIDANIKRMMEQRINGTAPKLPIPQTAIPSLPNFKESDDLAKRALKTPRVKQLSKALGHAQNAAKSAVVTLQDAGGKTIAFGTIVSKNYAITVASRIGNRKALIVKGHGQARVINIDRAQNIALIKLPKAVKALPWRHNAPVGSLVFSGGTYNTPGALSAKSRSVDGRMAAAMSQSGGFPAPIQNALDSAKKLAKRFNISIIEELVDQMLKSTEARGSYMKGNAPRGFRSVISHDSPLAPSQIGTPLVDKSGRLIGVNVSNAHFGTSYAVGINDLIKSFPQINGGKARPKTQTKKSGF